MRDRLAARYYTGPLGHFVAGVADWSEMLARWYGPRVARRLARTLRRR